MTIQVTQPDLLAAQATETASREHVFIDALIQSALAAQIDHIPDASPLLTDEL